MGSNSDKDKNGGDRPGPSLNLCKPGKEQTDMAGFSFSEEQEMFRSEMQRFAQRELAPGANERAKKESVSREMIKKMADVGLLGLNAPEEYGGQPSDFVSMGIAAEELAKVDLGIGMISLVNPIMSIALKAGTEEARQEWLPQFVKGDKLSCFAITEPGCGSDAAAIQMKAVHDQGYYILNGEKTSVTNGMNADIALVFAKTDATAGARGVTTFIVPLDLPGITRSRFADMGFIPLGRASLIMEDVKIPVKYRVGEEGKGFYVAMHGFNFWRVILGLAVLGLAESSLEDAIEYSKQRKAFGRPIAKFEGVSFKIAEAATHIEAARLLCYRTLWLRDQELPHTKEAAMCKWFAPKVAVDTIHNSLLIHGHIGYSEEYPVEQRLRDAIGFEMADGTAEIMKLIIVRELLGREFLPY